MGDPSLAIAQSIRQYHPSQHSNIMLLSLSEKERKIVEKLRKIPPDNLHEIENFIDFLSLRYQDRQLVEASKRLSSPDFQDIWDNDEDASYDEP
ncbi:MAG: hypothetical protein ACQERW_04390 [Cyanobacteriota bacterium]